MWKTKNSKIVINNFYKKANELNDEISRAYSKQKNKWKSMSTHD